MGKEGEGKGKERKGEQTLVKVIPAYGLAT